MQCSVLVLCIIYAKFWDVFWNSSLLWKDMTVMGTCRAGLSVFVQCSVLVHCKISCIFSFSVSDFYTVQAVQCFWFNIQSRQYFEVGCIVNVYAHNFLQTIGEEIGNCSIVTVTMFVNDRIIKRRPGWALSSDDIVRWLNIGILTYWNTVWGIIYWGYCDIEILRGE